jgi:hypothetical protein
MPTDPKVTTAEVAAGVAAATAALDAKMPGFARRQVTDEMIHDLVTVIIAAADKARGT